MKKLVKLSLLCLLATFMLSCDRMEFLKTGTVTDIKVKEDFNYISSSDGTIVMYLPKYYYTIYVDSVPYFSQKGTMFYIPDTLEIELGSEVNVYLVSFRCHIFTPSSIKQEQVFSSLALEREKRDQENRPFVVIAFVFIAVFLIYRIFR